MSLQMKSLLNRAIVDKVLAVMGFVFVLAALIVIAWTTTRDRRSGNKVSLKFTIAVL